MPLTTTWAKRLLIGAVIIALLAVLALLLLSVRPLPGAVDLKLAGVRQATNGALLVTVVLTNSTPRTFNVVDDTAGNPAFIVDSGGQYGTWLTDMTNQVRIHIAPGASLTNVLLVTNAPPRFRLKVVLRDLAAERRDLAGVVIHFLPDPLAQDLQRRRELPLPTSAWIESQPTER
jgi:hypothetical protein